MKNLSIILISLLVICSVVYGAGGLASMTFWPGPATITGTDEKIEGNSYGEYIDFKTGGDGKIMFGGAGTNTNFFTLDFGTSTYPSLDCNTGQINFVDGIRIPTSQIINFNNYTAKLYWSAIGNDCFQIGTQTNATASSGYIVLCDADDIGNVNRSPLSISANPVLRGYSSVVTEATDYWEITHDGANTVLNSGKGDLTVGANICPVADNTYYIGDNDDDTPHAYKGVCLKDTTNGRYYRIEIINGTITATDLTD